MGPIFVYYELNEFYQSHSEYGYILFKLRHVDFS